MWGWWGEGWEEEVVVAVPFGEEGWEEGWEVEREPGWEEVGGVVEGATTTRGGVGCVVVVMEGRLLDEGGGAVGWVGPPQRFPISAEG